MHEFNFEHPAWQAPIIRLMVDEKFQGKGYGRFGMQNMVEIGNRIFEETLAVLKLRP